MKQKTLFLICLLLTTISLSASATTFNVGGINYDIISEEEQTVQVGDNSGFSGDAVIPESVEHGGKQYSVTTIGENAFSGCSNLTSVTIPVSVTRIRDYAFYNCCGLNSITIPTSINSISIYSFSGCEGVTTIKVIVFDESAFLNNKLAYKLRRLFDKPIMLVNESGEEIKDFVIPNGITTIELEAFSNCSGLTSVTIPSSVNLIYFNSFYNCNGLTSVIVSIFDKSAFLKNDLGECISYIPNDPPIVLIDENGEEIKDFVIPNDITWIGSSAFRNCSGLTSVNIPNSVTSIGLGAFYNCSGLTSVTIPESVTFIDEIAFSGCSSLTSVTIPASVTTIGYAAFSGCNSLASLKVSITDISAFLKNNVAGQLQSVAKKPIVLVDECGEEIKDFIIPDDITTIGDYAFYNCSGLTSVTIPNNVTYVGDYAFNYCSGLTSVNIPNSVTTIGAGAFSGCSGLTSVTIPATVTSINSYAFEGCSGLTSVKVCINDKSAFINNQVANLIRNSIGKPIVLISENGEEIKDFIIPDDITTIGSNAFYNCSGLTSVNIPNSVTTIGAGAFSGCSGLTSVTIPNSITSIGECAFRECSGLTSVNIPNSVTSIGYEAFYGCSGLTSVTIPATVTSINSYAFEGCSGLTSVKVCINDKSAFINNQVANLVRNSIGKPLVLINESGEEIHNFVIPDDITNIGDYAFYNCSGLTSVNIPNSITTIGDYAFYNCSGLTSVTIPNNVTYVGDYAFNYCSGLTSVTIPATVTSINRYAFRGCDALATVKASVSNKSAFVNNQVAYKLMQAVGKPIPFILIDESGEEIKDFVVPDDITSIGEYTFYYCSGLTSVTIPASVTSISHSAFFFCSNLSSLTIPSSVASIGDGVYMIVAYCDNLATVKVCINDKSAFINNQVAYLLSRATGKPLVLIDESGEEIKDFVIPDDITSVGDYAFYNCSDLTSVTIPYSVTSISGNAFTGCSGLSSITSKIVNIFPVQTGTFSGITPECTLTVPKGMVSDYADNGWNQFGGGIIDESIRCIDGIYYALDSGKKTATVTNQYGYDGDSDYSWLKATYAGTLDIPDVVTYDGEQYSVTFIGKNALRKCNDLTAVYLPDGLTDAATLKDLQAKIYVNRGTTSLLALWTIGMEPYEKNTDNVLTAPKFDIATTQTTATLKATPVYPEYTYAYNDMIPLGEEGIRWTGLYPEYSEEVTLNVMLGTQCYESKQTFTTQSLAPKVIASQRTASSITFKGIYTEGDADVDDEYTLTVEGENILGDTKTLTGLEPNTGYTAYFTVRVHYGDNGQYTKSYTGTSTLQTEPISFTTMPAKIITADDVIVSSAVNLNDAETTAGFEWRVAGGDEDLFESKCGQAYLYEGMMEGTIHKLNPNYLWKFRPYYQSANGYYYYGNWKGIDLSDNQSYFEPTVHTYAGVEMGDGTATVSGYAQRGSDEIAEEGFEYWEESGNTSDAPLHAPAYASIPENAMKVLADGTLMQAQLTGLTPNSTYGYVAFVRTTKGKTYYGVVRQFTTGEHQQATSVEAFNAKQAPTNEAIYDLLGRKHDNLHKGVNIIRMEDGSTRKVYVK